MKQFLATHPFVLMEAAVIERLRRSGEVYLHDTLVNAPLIYDPVAKEIMSAIYLEYMRLACHENLPILVCTPCAKSRFIEEQDLAESCKMATAADLIDIACDAATISL